MSVLPESLQAVFREIENKMLPIADYDVSAALERFCKAQEDGGHDSPSLLRAESMAFDFCSNYHHDEDGWGTYYGPLFAAVRDGKLCGSPSIEHVTPAILEYWQTRSQEAVHPFLRLRYADLVWDFTPRICKKSAGIACAQTVVDSTVELVAKNLFEMSRDIGDELTRALSIALSINDSDRVGRLAMAIIDTESDAGNLDQPGTWILSFHSLIENKKVSLTPELEQQIIEGMERHLSKMATINPDTGYALDHLAAQDTAIRLAAYYNRKSRLDDLRRVLVFWAAAVKPIAKTAMAMLGVAWLQQAYEQLLKYHIKDEADSVAILMHELGQNTRKDLVRTCVKTEVPQKEIGEWIAAMMDDVEDEVVARICKEFIPNLGEIKKQLTSNAARSVLFDVFEHCNIDDEGREISRVGSLKDHFDGRVVTQISQNMKFEEFWLALALKEWTKRFDATPERIIVRLYQSPVFRDDRKHILRCGVEAYIRGDHISAVHVLIPQVEQAFRSLLSMTGRNIYKRPRKHGGIDLKMLDDLLRDPVTTQVFGPDCVRYFKTLLSDRRGWNLRNDVCHGLGSIPHGSVFSDRVMHVLLILSMARRASDNQADE